METGPAVSAGDRAGLGIPLLPVSSPPYPASSMGSFPGLSKVAEDYL